MVKLVAVDMDGTLLTESKEITQRSRDVISRMQESGIEFVICSGRDYESASELVKQAGIACSYICDSGAMVHLADGNVIEQYPMDNWQIKSVLQQLSGNNLIAQLRTNNGSYIMAEPESALHFFLEELPTIMGGGTKNARTLSRGRELLEKVKYVGNIDNFLRGRVEVYKIFAASRHLKTLNRIKKQCGQLDGLAVASSFPTNIEITHKDAQKGLALLRYAKRKGIGMDEVMAIGDSENDYSMLSMDFGYTVAMGNSDESIKKIAKYETATNDMDGVAAAVERWVFQ